MHHSTKLRTMVIRKDAVFYIQPATMELILNNFVMLQQLLRFLYAKVITIVRLSVQTLQH
jgi:hypothetical protein